MSKPNRCEYPFKACAAVQERDALRASLAAAEDKNATLMRDLELACRDLAAVKLSRDAAEARLADEVRHADELAAHLTTALTICSDDLGYEWTHCGDDEPSRALLAAHAARRKDDK